MFLHHSCALPHQPLSIEIVWQQEARYFTFFFIASPLLSDHVSSFMQAAEQWQVLLRLQPSQPAVQHSAVPSGRGGLPGPAVRRVQQQALQGLVLQVEALHQSGR